jgi:hypothetical protein
MVPSDTSELIAMFEDLPNADRIERAKAKMKQVLDHFRYLLELHANNAFVVYSDTLARQIPFSHAANAFNVFQRSMHQFEIVRLCALWDRAGIDKENILTVVELIDSAPIIDALADEMRSHWADRGPARLFNPSEDPKEAAIVEEVQKRHPIEFGDQQAVKAKAGLRKVIADAREIEGSLRLTSVLNHRHKHLAHSLTITSKEKQRPVPPANYGDETQILDASIPIVEAIYCWVNGGSVSIDNSRQINERNAEALWRGCRIKVLR